MIRKTLLLLLVVSSALPANAAGLRFHCLITGEERTSCCCTGSTTQACGGGACKMAARSRPSCCGHCARTNRPQVTGSGACCRTSLATPDAADAPTVEATDLDLSAVPAPLLVTCDPAGDFPKLPASVFGTGPPPLLLGCTLRC